MLNLHGLRTSIIIYLCVCVTFFIIGQREGAAGAVLVCMFLHGLYIAVTPPGKVPKRARGAYQRGQREATGSFLAANPDAAHALYYASKLPPDDLLKFMRLLVETRYQFDQEVLTELADLLREEKDDHP